MAESYAELAGACPEEDIEYLRELLSDDMRCRISCTFVRGEYGNLMFTVDPSPLHWSRQREWPWTIRNAELQPHHTVLDIGSGWSVLKYAMARRCKHVTALDIDEPSIRKANETINKLGFADKITQIQGDARRLPFADGSFDCVVSVSTLEHIIGEHTVCVREAVRVCKNGGIVLMTMDVAAEEPGERNFCIDLRQASEIMLSLGIQSTMPTNAIGALMDLETPPVKIVVLMIKYVKPLK